ncbi:hypothetical protein LY76DRAFT_596845 [Colletotrichum caudatum]|nr:hypothetical protein LY76DRAFT_596845 [Colletotrichum caudatum]
MAMLRCRARNRVSVGPGWPGSRLLAGSLLIPPPGCSSWEARIPRRESRGKGGGGRLAAAAAAAAADYVHSRVGLTFTTR